jgi:glycosyltransferase involved in cell wall biosynthesis
MDPQLPAVPTVSIVCPAFEEEEVISLFHEELFRVLRALETQYRFEIIYIDDGSRDGTLARMDSIAQLDPRVRVLALARNFGKEKALLAGLEHATGAMVVTLDTDLQHPPEVIPQLLEKAKGPCEIVMGVRQDYQQGTWLKRLAARLFYRVQNFVGDTDIAPQGSDFLLMKRRTVDVLLAMQERQRFLKGLIYWTGLPRAEVAYTPNTRRAGQTKFSFRRLIALGADCLYSFSTNPLRLACHFGATAVGVGLFLALWFLVQGMFWPGSVWFSWGYLIVLLHILGGSILFSLGVLGALAGRILEQLKERPQYLLKYDSKAPVDAAMTSSHATNQAA